VRRVRQLPARPDRKTLVLSGKLPAPLFGLFMQQMRLRAVRRLPIAFGWLTKRGDPATARWMKPVLAGLLPRGQLTEIGDSYTLIPLDQPARLARAIRDLGDELATEDGSRGAHHVG
jgi:hypothetical protein